jgi:hypothetical protein
MLGNNPVSRDVSGEDFEQGYFQSERVEVEGDGRAILKRNSGFDSFSDDEYWEGQDKTAFAEADAYEVAKEMGYEDLVPPTRLRVERGQYHSIQLWVEDSDTLANKVRYGDGPPTVPAEQVKALMILDAVVGNADRHEQNLLVDRNNNLVGIDHGLSFTGSRPPNREVFRAQGSFRTYIFNKIRTGPFSFTDEDRERVRRVRNNVDILDLIRSDFGDAEADAFRARCDELINYGDEYIDYGGNLE